MTEPVSQPAAAVGEDDEIGLLDLLIVIARHKKLVIGLPIAAGLVALAIAMVMPKIYTGTTRIMPPQQGQSSAAAALGALTGLGGGGGGAIGQALGIKNPNDLYVGILKSNTISDRMIERFKLKELYGTPTLIGTRAALAGESRIIAGKDGLITVEVDDEDPKRAAEMANAYVEELGELMQGLAVTEAAQRRLFFERELKTVREKLAAAEMNLRGVQEKTGLILPGEQAKAIFDAFTDVRARIAAKEVEIASMRAFATENNPGLARARQELASLQAQLVKLESSRDPRTQGDILVPTGKVAEAGLEYLRQARDLKYYETLFELLAKQFEMAKIDEARDAAIIQVVDKATPPDYKSSPKRGLIAVAATAAGFLLAIVIALGREAWTGLSRSPRRAARIEELTATLRGRRAG